jgi:hypothetical protein
VLATLPTKHFLTNGPYNAKANEEFEVQYDNYPMCAGQGFDRFQGTASWGGVSTTLGNNNGSDFPGIAGSMRVKFSQPGDYNAVANITVDCLDRGCRNTCPAHGAIDVHIRQGDAPLQTARNVCRVR